MGRNFYTLLPILMIAAFATAFHYRDDPQRPFEILTIIGWWGFGITLFIAFIMVFVTDKEEPNYEARIARFFILPVMNLIAIGITILAKVLVS